MAQKDDTNSPSAPTMAELLELICPQVEKIEEGFKGIRVTLDALAEHLGGASLVRPAPPAAADSEGAADEQTDEAAADAKPVASTKSPPPAAAVPVPSTAPPVTTPPPPAPEVPVVVQTRPPAAQPVAVPIPVSGAGGGNWSQIIFGDALGTVPGISHLSGILLSDVYDSDNDAVNMLGNLLTLRSATAERKPKLLKDVGEAFYLWKPMGEAALRDGLIAWIHSLLDEAGIANRIELVQAGDRYDMQRHNSRERGVEVVDVCGWVVLRENGKVYSKANVSAR